MAKPNPESDEYSWLYDPEQRPEAHATENHHRVRRAALMTIAAMVLVGGAVGADYYTNRHDDSGVNAHTGNIAGTEPSGASEPSAKPSPHKPTQAECIAKLPMSLKLAQKLMISADARTVDAVSAVVAANDLGGVILMGPTPTAEAVRAMQTAQKIPLLIATDQEGGTVQRYVGGGTLPAAAEVAQSWSPSEARQKVEQSDRYLKSQGVNMNLAPLADVAPAAGSSVLGSRLFSSDPAVVTRYARAYVQAGLTTGVLPTLKHFPGLGATTQNTDYGSASSSAELKPYKALAGTKAAIMVGNQIVPGVSDGQPASLSQPVITDLLRKQLGYQDNVVITDSLSAVAITSSYTISEAAVRAWEAGADISLIVSDHAGLSAEQQAQEIVSLGMTALKSGQLEVSAVNKSVARLWALPQKHVDACDIIN